MAKKPNKADEKPQIERFREAVRNMVTAGELNPTEADEALSTLVLKTASNETHVMRPDAQDVESNLNN